jgi:hypothetical protein
VEAKEYDQVLSFFLNLIHYAQIQGIGNSSNIANTYEDDNKWTKICSKIQFNLGLMGL